MANGTVYTVTFSPGGVATIKETTPNGRSNTLTGMWTQKEIFVGVYNEYEGPLCGEEVCEDGKIYDSWTNS